MMSKLMGALLGVSLLVGCGGTSEAEFATTADEVAPEIKHELGWLDGEQMCFEFWNTRPGTPVRKKAYGVLAIDPDHPQDGDEGNDCTYGEEHGERAGFFLTALGPEANDENVVHGFLAEYGEDLVSHVKLRGSWQPLTSISTIRTAVAAGLVREIDTGARFVYRVTDPEECHGPHVD